MNSAHITKEDTRLLKGFGILIIFLHNFFHVLPSWNIENEFDFRRERVSYFLGHITDDGFSFVGLLFAYLGHFGVQLFIFLSAYGLMRSYAGREKINALTFTGSRIRKLYPTFVLAVLLFLTLHIVTTRTFNHPELYISSILKLSFLSNFFPHQSFEPCGPWWFYSMIVQFYLIFPVMKKLFEKYGHTPFWIISLIIYMTDLRFNDQLINLGLYLNTTVIGHIPVLYLGIAAASRKPEQSVPLWLLPVALLVFTAGNFFAEAWFFSRLAITVIILYAFGGLKRSGFHSNTLKRIVLYLGDMSMYIFAVNGFLRHPFIMKIRTTDSTAVKFLMVLLFSGLVILVGWGIKKAETLIFRKRVVENAS